MSRKYRGPTPPPPMEIPAVAPAEPGRHAGLLVGDAKSASPPLQSATDRANVRVELLRLAHRHDHNEQQIVERCKALEAYVFGDQPADKATF